MHFLATVLTTASLASTVLSHGIITKPYPRTIGAASLAACGSSVQNNIKGDNTSHVEGLPEAAAKDPSYNAAECNLWLCRGLQFADNKDILSWTVGQKVSIEVNIRIKHTGSANVSIVDTKTNTIVGQQLLYWPIYADDKAATLPANNTKFDITVPDLGKSCTVAGDCVLQWWWYGTAAKQTYESCLDFVIAPMTPMKARSRFWRF